MDKVNLLLVDDQPGKLLSYQAILAGLGENLVSARSGREALQCLLKQEFALILLDVMMPDMDGFETATLIRQHPRLEQTPIIFITAFSMSELDRLKGYELGAVDYVFAPIVPEILRAKASVFVELYRKRQELQSLNQTLTQTNAALIAEVAERRRAEAALEEEHASLARRVEERTKELRTANEKLARAARLKDEFLANMSHELRTPLNAILGISEALQEQVYGLLNENQLQALGDVEESGRHLLALINDILDLSKIEMGKLKLEMVPVGVAWVCEASLHFINQIAQQKRLKVVTTIDSAVTTIQADERQLKQILVNLLSNAVKFTPEGGKIGLEVVGNAEQETVYFTVWDNGIGIVRKNLERLFQPFVQLDSSLSRQYSGTGLGLALVHRLVELHGGGISVESEPGEGSRFIVSLPWPAENLTDRAEKETFTAKPITTLASLGGVIPVSNGKCKATSRLILLVEDNESSIRTVSDYLCAKSYRVIVVRNGSEVVNLAREERPEVILMDIQIPGMDGLEAIRRVRAEAELSNIPIIALTALAMCGDREKCLAAGANDYMSKPIQLKKLVEMIEIQRKKSRQNNLT
ncbi:response regulator [candidate division KSB1 bacterium]|nr:response regulator [candidate division KSB1 bacterium]